jgi:hypothetical protein
MPKRQDPEPSTFELCVIIAEWLHSYRAGASRRPCWAHLPAVFRPEGDASQRGLTAAHRWRPGACGLDRHGAVLTGAPFKMGVHSWASAIRVTWIE